jgi:hypothetical protein
MQLGEGPWSPQRRRPKAIRCRSFSRFSGTPSTLRGEREGGRFPALDRLDLLENGRLLLGNDARGGLSRPSADELIIDGAEFALDHLAGWRDPGDQPAAGLGSLRPAGGTAVEEIRSPEVIIARGVRRLTKLGSSQFVSSSRPRPAWWAPTTPPWRATLQKVVGQARHS